MEIKKSSQRPLESLACVEPECELYGQRGQGNLKERKTYGKDEIRYLRCTHCGSEFSERKNTALWNTKVREAKAISVADHLSEGCSLKGTARMVGVDSSVVRRLNKCAGRHGSAHHDEHAKELEVEALQGDERHGYAGSKSNPAWEAELIDPESKFIVSHVQGKRDQELIEELLQDGASRLANPRDLVLMTDGDANYASLFPEIFGEPYQPSRKGTQGRLPKIRYRIPRSLAHVQVIKRRVKRRLVQIEVRYTHGSKKRVDQALNRLGYSVPNTSAIERYNATARRMGIFQIRKTLAFARRDDSKEHLGWWNTAVYNWCRIHRSLRRVLDQPNGRQLYQQLTPAMAIGLADHVFTVAELLLSPVYP